MPVTAGSTNHDDVVLSSVRSTGATGDWIPASAGMTDEGRLSVCHSEERSDEESRDLGWGVDPCMNDRFL